MIYFSYLLTLKVLITKGEKERTVVLIKKDFTSCVFSKWKGQRRMPYVYGITEDIDNLYTLIFSRILAI